jgi:DNA-directed RNA polymerase specialized sigma24 family protein
MFPNTQWTELARATLHGDGAGRAALEALCRGYWEPVRQFILQRGWPMDEAADLTQSFFLFLMEKNVLHRAEREKGRFRSFLQGVLNNFLLTERDRRRAQKRGGAMACEELDEDVAPVEETAAREFDRQWALAIMQGALQKVSGECMAKRGEGFFEIIAVYIGGKGEVLPQEVAAEKAGLTPGNFRSEIHLWRQKLREYLRAEVRRTVAAPHEVEEEMSYLWQLLSAA